MIRNILNVTHRGIQLTLQKNGLRHYASGTVEKLSVTMCSPYQTYMKDEQVDQVNMTTLEGDIGILFQHVPTIQQLVPGVIEFIQAGSSKRLFTSGGFAVMDPKSRLNISVTEAFPLDAFSREKLSALISDTQAALNRTTDAKEKASLEVKMQVFEALKYHLK